MPQLHIPLKLVFACGITSSCYRRSFQLAYFTAVTLQAQRRSAYSHSIIARPPTKLPQSSLSPSQHAITNSEVLSQSLPVPKLPLPLARPHAPRPIIPLVLPLRVKSTKIYCRPTCSARLARRANVVFYDTEDQARRDGYRPCKRCKPDDTTFVGGGEEVVTRVTALLWTKKDDLTMKRGIKELAKEVGVTPSYLCRVFKKSMGVTVGAYMKEFEREASEGETESSVQSLSSVGSGVVGVGMGFLTPATTARSSSAPAEGRERGPADEDVGNVEQDMDLDLDFDFNEWIWTEFLE